MYTPSSSSVYAVTISLCPLGRVYTTVFCAGCVYKTGAYAAPGRVWTIGALAAPGLVYTTDRGLCCTWTCLQTGAWAAPGRVCTTEACACLKYRYRFIDYQYGTTVYILIELSINRLSNMGILKNYRLIDNEPRKNNYRYRSLEKVLSAKYFCERATSEILF